MGLYALPFAFVDLWKHTEEMNPNVAHPKNRPASTVQILHLSGDLKCLNLPMAHARLCTPTSKETVCTTVPVCNRPNTHPPTHTHLLCVAKKDCRNVTAIGRVCARVFVEKGGGEGLKQQKDTRIMSLMKVADTLLPLSLHPTCLRVPLMEPPRSVTTLGSLPGLPQCFITTTLTTSTWNQCHSFNHSVNEGRVGCGETWGGVSIFLPS